MRSQLNFWNFHPLPPLLVGGGQMWPPRVIREPKNPGSNRVNGKFLWLGLLNPSLRTMMKMDISNPRYGIWNLSIHKIEIKCDLFSFWLSLCLRKSLGLRNRFPNTSLVLLEHGYSPHPHNKSKFSLSEISKLLMRPADLRKLFSFPRYRWQE